MLGRAVRGRDSAGPLRQLVAIGVALAATACGDEFASEPDPGSVDGCLAMRFSSEHFVQVPDAADLDPVAPFTIDLRVF